MLTMYSTDWCGYCHRLKSQLDRERITYRVVDIEREPEAAAFVAGINGGSHTVPTVRFPDGSALSNPTIADIRNRLQALDGRAGQAPRGEQGN